MDTIYTIEEVEFKVGKEVYDVSSISLNLSLNEITKLKKIFSEYKCHET